MLKSLVGQDAAKPARQRVENEASICQALFDADWYCARYPDLRNVADPLQHFIEYGVDEGRDPHPLFNANWYRAENPDVAETGINPLAHFLLFGGLEGRDPHPIFDASWYLQKNPGVKRAARNPLLHYLTHGQHESANPNPLFDTDWYAARNPEHALLGKGPLYHYVTAGAARGRDPGPRLSARIYRALTPGFDPARDEPIAHHRSRSQKYDTSWREIERRHPIAVVFLARSETGSTQGLDSFVSSYRTHQAGVGHDLIVIRKGGMRKPGARLALDLMLADLEPQYLDIDDTGYDIQAYLRSASVLPHDYVCFLNTHAEILADDWLAKLAQAVMQPGIGAAGASASYESIYDSLALQLKAVWLAEEAGVPFDPVLAEEFRMPLELHAPKWMQRGRAEALPEAETSLDPSVTAIDRDLGYLKQWEACTGVDGPFFTFDRFKRFPNPHLRSNAFIIRRDLLVELDLRLDDSKRACLEFESGPTSLGARLQARGLEVVLVGADGRLYRVEEWPESRTFRLGEQENLLVSDNRVREYKTLPEHERRRLQRISWGEYVAAVPASYRKLGFDFEKGPLRLPPLPAEPIAQGRRRKFSVVIPTHNRLSLVQEALTTILGQDYPHWECVVFDNCSAEPLREHVDSLGDERVSYARSDRFLPVTESWNQAIDHATGDYVILLGDDDGLVPDCFSRLAEILDTFSDPDLVYSSLYQFFHPGVAPWEPSGTVNELQYGLFFNGQSHEFALSREMACASVDASLRFRRCFTFNMQAFFYNRRFLDSMRRDGKVFHSPFPDYYLANVTLRQAASVVVAPRPLTVAGVSRKSYGFTLFNRQQEKGDAMLNTAFEQDPLYGSVKDVLLPGPTYNSNYLLTMFHVADALAGEKIAPIRTDRYRRIQILHALGGMQGVRDGQALPDDIRLSAEELDWVAQLRHLAASDSEELDAIAAQVAMYVPQPLAVRQKSLATGEFATLPELFSALRTRSLAV